MRFVSPIMKYISIPMLLALIAQFDLELQQHDVYLHADLEKTIYIGQPEGFLPKEKEDHVCQYIFFFNDLK